jgi:hypothetical protein
MLVCQNVESEFMPRCGQRCSCAYEYFGAGLLLAIPRESSAEMWPTLSLFLRLRIVQRRPSDIQNSKADLGLCG